jgi:deoxyribonuclease-4
MPILGAHMSIAGGYYRAVEDAARVGCDCVQLFTKNNNQWRAKAIGDDDADRFQAALAQEHISHPLSHTSYLINLASPDKALWKKSVDAFVVELQRAERLGIPYVVVHPGAFTTADEETGIRNVAAALDEALRQTRGMAVCPLLENTAGQGTCLGWKFEQLAAIIDRVKSTDRVGVCIDTCHAFAAGYPLAPKKEYLATMRALDRTVGLKRVKAFHLNDSKREQGSRVDRHEHIGKGHIGVEGFRNLLNDRRFRRVPMYLETPKGTHRGREWDKINLATLRGLVECDATLVARAPSQTKAARKSARSPSNQ